jgi:cobalt transporter subunit CbtA
MIGRIVLATLIAGMLAGLVLAGIQHVRLTPLILKGEVYEKASEPAAAAIAEASKPCVENMPGMKMCSEEGRAEWEPAEGLQRTLFTTAASLLAGAGFATMLAGVSFLTNIPITKQNGMIWGVCGFLAVAVAPAVGLPPEVPGMPVADLLSRQIWWVGTIAATTIGIYLINLRPELWAKVLAVVIIASPHIIGAPIAPETPTTVPPRLAAEFVANSIAAAAVFWSALGLFLGYALDRYQKDLSSL